MTEEEKSIYISAIEKYGVDNQISQLHEEIGELMTAINRFKRGRVAIDAIEEEIVDVEIMLEQMKVIFNCKEDDLKQLRKHKTTRLKERLHGKSL